MLPSLCGPPTAQGAKGRSRSHDWFLWFLFCHEASWETHQLGCGFVSLEAWRPDIILWCGVYGARHGLFSGPCVRCGAGVAANLAQAVHWPWRPALATSEAGSRAQGHPQLAMGMIPGSLPAVMVCLPAVPIHSFYGLS